MQCNVPETKGQSINIEHSDGSHVEKDKHPTFHDKISDEGGILGITNMVADPSEKKSSEDARDADGARYEPRQSCLYRYQRHRDLMTNTSSEPLWRP